ncbi:MAG: elongation factor EF-2 [Candidatus Nanoarchaeia archaeon]|nr:elongation factor EF-2 [Candidatus Nanoarchaeia archaeon]
MAKEEKVSIEEMFRMKEKIRNMGIVAHIDHGKSTLSDSLLAGAGLLSMKVAGSARATDTLEEEQKRGITIQNTAVSMVHHVDDDFYLINLIDTPGHVDFGGEVTKALRAVDGALIVVCAVEGIMPQTETVIKQCMKEKVKPILLINKVDRLLNELKLTPQQMQDRFIGIIDEFNKLIYVMAPEEFKKEWQCRVNEGTVAFGTAYHKWAMSFPYMQKHGISFKDVIETYQGTDEERNVKIEKLAEKAPIHKVLLNMVTKHLPNPIQAQKYRIPHLWKGDLESDVGKSLLSCNEKGEPLFTVTAVTVDEKAGEIAFGRIFSGEIKKGDILFMNKQTKEVRAQQLFIQLVGKRVPIESIPAGNTAAIIGIKGAFSGETVSINPVTPFESISHLFDAVVTKAVEPKNPKDLPKLIEILREISQEDPTIKIKINQETGEQLISGLGELHLEWVEHKIKKYKGLEIITSKPIVVYRETINEKSPEVEGKSPNKHNKFYITVEPLEQSIKEAINRGDIEEFSMKRKKLDVWETLNKFGMEKEEAKKVKQISGSNVLIDNTKGIVHINEVLEMVFEAMDQVISDGPLAREMLSGVKIRIHDIKLHEDAIHRGPAQIIPAVRQAIRDAVLLAKPLLFEPIQTIRIDTPTKYMGNVTGLVQARRGSVVNVTEELGRTVIKAELPVSQMFGFTSELRSVSEGRGSWSLVDSQFKQLPRSLQEETVISIRKRKGLPAQSPVTF